MTLLLISFGGQVLVLLRLVCGNVLFPLYDTVLLHLSLGRDVHKLMIGSRNFLKYRKYSKLMRAKKLAELFS